MQTLHPEFPSIQCPTCNGTGIQPAAQPVDGRSRTQVTIDEWLRDFRAVAPEHLDRIEVLAAMALRCHSAEGALAMILALDTRETQRDGELVRQRGKYANLALDHFAAYGRADALFTPPSGR